MRSPIATWSASRTRRWRCAGMLQYAIVTDSNGYVPAHNTRFAQPLTGNTEQD